MPRRPATYPCLLFNRTAVERLLDVDAVIAAVEGGFRRLGQGERDSSGVTALHPPGGGFHVKAAVFRAGPSDRLYLAAKLNANFPLNPSALGLPTIQGVVGLFDAVHGVPLAVMDSTSITVLRTAAATAVAVKHLARPDAHVLTVVGCGAQSRAQVAAVARVRSLTRVAAADVNREAAHRFAQEMSAQIGLPVEAVTDIHAAVAASDVVITCTPSTVPLLGRADIRPGTLVAAVGADSDHKSEIEPDLMGAALLVTDATSQCATIGDLHHAIEAGTATVDSVWAELSQVVAGTAGPRPAGRDVIVFDSTGLPFQDVVAAALVFERGKEQGVGVEFDFRA